MRTSLLASQLIALIVLNACTSTSTVAHPEPRATTSAPELAPPDAHVPMARASDTSTPAESAPAAAPLPLIRLPNGIQVDRARGEVRVPATIAITQGWLEQVACVTGTRDHESLVSVDCKPSEVHAALLILGLEPGAPGRWHYDHGTVRTDAPSGPALKVLVRYLDGDMQREANVLDWIRGADGRSFPGAWVFAGSEIARNPASFGPGEHYVADFTGSLVGLVTFGDETVAATAVYSDQAELESPNWEAWSERMPPEGTVATLVFVRDP